MPISEQLVTSNTVKAMSLNMNVDIPESKAKQTKAMVYRSHQRLKQQLRNIDSERSKSLSNINHDLEMTKDALKALRISRRQARRQSIGRHSTRVLNSESNFGQKSMANTSTAPLHRRSSVPFEANSSSNCPGRFSEVSEAFTNVTYDVCKQKGLSSTLIQLLFSFDQGMRFENPHTNSRLSTLINSHATLARV